MREFKEVESLFIEGAGCKLGYGDQITSFWHDVHTPGKPYLCLNDAHLTYEQTIELRDWLNKALGDNEWKPLKLEPGVTYFVCQHHPVSDMQRFPCGECGWGET